MAASSRVPTARWLWYGLSLFGVLTFAIGVFFIVEPHETLKVFTVILGIFLLVDGAFATVGAIIGRGEGRGVLAIVGVLGVLVGLVLIEEPFGALHVFVIILGIWFVVAGVARFVYAFTLTEGRGTSIFVALIDAAAGILLLGWPSIGLSTVGVIVGIVLVLRGALFLLAGWAGLRVERTPDEPAAQPTG